jgi:hypothetical protein
MEKPDQHLARESQGVYVCIDSGDRYELTRSPSARSMGAWQSTWPGSLGVVSQPTSRPCVNQNCGQREASCSPWIEDGGGAAHILLARSPNSRRIHEWSGR